MAFVWGLVTGFFVSVISFTLGCLFSRDWGLAPSPGRETILPSVPNSRRSPRKRPKSVSEEEQWRREKQSESAPASPSAIPPGDIYAGPF